MANKVTTSGQAQVSLTEGGQTLQIMGDDSVGGTSFASAPINIEKNSDYLTRLPVKVERGHMVIKVERVDNGRTLASATIPDALEPASSTEGSMTFVNLPFVSGGADQIRIVMANAESGPAGPIIHIGGILGASRYSDLGQPHICGHAIREC